MPKHIDNFIIMNPVDNCVTAFEDLSKGSQIQIGESSIIINQNISLGHNIASEDIRKGDLEKYSSTVSIYAL